MFTKIEKEPGCTPTLYPSAPGEPGLSPFVYEPSNDDRSAATLSRIIDEDEAEECVVTVETPYGDYNVPGSYDAGKFTAITPELTQTFIEAECLDLLGVWVVLHEYLSIRGKTWVARPLHQDLLAERLGVSPKTVWRYLKRLEEAGLVTKISGDQHPREGTRRNAAWCYLPHLIRVRTSELVRAASVSAPANVKTKNSKRAKSTAADRSSRATNSQNHSTTGTESSGQETTLSELRTEMTVSYSLLREGDLVKSELEKTTFVNEEQLKTIRKHLAFEEEVFILYGIETFEQLTNSQASDLIQSSLGKYPELQKRLERIHDDLVDRQRTIDSQAVLDTEARIEQWRTEAVEPPSWLRELAKQQRTGSKETTIPKKTIPASEPFEAPVFDRTDVRELSNALRQRLLMPQR